MSRSFLCHPSYGIEYCPSHWMTFADLLLSRCLLIPFARSVENITPGDLNWNFDRLVWMVKLVLLLHLEFNFLFMNESAQSRSALRNLLKTMRTQSFNFLFTLRDVVLGWLEQWSLMTLHFALLQNDFSLRWRFNSGFSFSCSGSCLRSGLCWHLCFTPLNSPLLTF